MRGKIHLTAGFCAGACLAAECFQMNLQNSTTQMMILVLSSAFGSLLPDIDQPESTIGRKIPLVPKIIHRTFGHRGFTHSLLCMVILNVFLTVFQSKFLVAGFCAGYLTHLILDMLNPTGVPLLYPWKKKIHLLNIPSDSPLQYALCVGMILYTAVYCAPTVQEGLTTLAMIHHF